jgi:hypothetical protein
VKRGELVEGSDFWCDENLTYTKRLAQAIVADCSTLAQHVDLFRAYAQRHEVTFADFARVEFGGATPELLDAIAQVAKLGKGKAAS